MLHSLKSLGLATRLITVILLILLGVVTVNYVIFVARYRKSATNSMVERAAAFTAVADESKNHAADLNKLGAFDMASLLADLNQTLEAGKPYTEAKIFGTIPVVAGWTAAQDAAKKEHIDFKVTAFEARNKENEPAADSFAGKLPAELTTTVGAGGDEVIHRTDEATNSLHYTRAIRPGQQCMLCHGPPDPSPPADGVLPCKKDILAPL